jgi:hypothetical protein
MSLDKCFAKVYCDPANAAVALVRFDYRVPEDLERAFDQFAREKVEASRLRRASHSSHLPMRASAKFEILDAPMARTAELIATLPTRHAHMDVACARPVNVHQVGAEMRAI